MRQFLFILLFLTVACRVEAACSNYGDTTVESTHLGSGFITAGSVTLAAGTCSSIVIDVTGNCNVNVALYNSAGAGQTITTPITSSGSTACVTGWNTLTIPTQNVVPNCYFLAVQNDAANICYAAGTINRYAQKAQAYGAFVDMTGNGPNAALSLSIYAIVCPILNIDVPGFGLLLKGGHQ